MTRHLVLAALFSLCGPSLARAGEPMSARLVYTVDDGSGACASEVDFRRKVAARLGYDPFDAEASWIFRVRIDGRRKRPHAEIVTERAGKPNGKRELDEGTCDALSETVASTVAIAIDPVAASPAPSATPTAQPEPAPTPAAPPAPTQQAPASAPADQKAEGAPIVPLVYLDATAAVGRTAGVALGARGGAGIQYRAVSIAAEARGEATPEAVKVTSLDSANWSVFSGALVACGHKSFFEMCGVGAVGSLQAKARDVTRPSLKGTFFATLGARIGIEIPLTTDIAFRGNLELDIPLVRTTFNIGGQPVWTAPVVQGTLGIGVEARFR